MDQESDGDRLETRRRAGDREQPERRANGCGSPHRAHGRRPRARCGLRPLPICIPRFSSICHVDRVGCAAPARICYRCGRLLHPRGIHGIRRRRRRLADPPLRRHSYSRSTTATQQHLRVSCESQLTATEQLRAQTRSQTVGSHSGRLTVREVGSGCSSAVDGCSLWMDVLVCSVCSLWLRLGQSCGLLSANSPVPDHSAHCISFSSHVRPSVEAQAAHHHLAVPQ